MTCGERYRRMRNAIVLARPINRTWPAKAVQAIYKCKEMAGAEPADQPLVLDLHLAHAPGTCELRQRDAADQDALAWSPGASHSSGCSKRYTAADET